MSGRRKKSKSKKVTRRSSSSKRYGLLAEEAERVRSDPARAALVEKVLLGVACRDPSKIRRTVLIKFAADLMIPLTAAQKADGGALCGAVRTGLLNIAKKAKRSGSKAGFFTRLKRWVSSNWRSAVAAGAFAATALCRTPSFQGNAICAYWNEFGNEAVNLIAAPYRTVKEEYHSFRDRQQSRSLKRRAMSIKKLSAERKRLAAETGLTEAKAALVLANVQLVEKCIGRDRLYFEEMKRKLENPTWVESTAQFLHLGNDAFKLFAKIALATKLGGVPGVVAGLAVDPLLDYAKSPRASSDLDAICGQLKQESKV